MTRGERQRRDGSSKRVQLTSGDHGGPKDKKSKAARKPTVQGGNTSRAAKLREVQRFREAIRAAEQRRTARQDAPATAPAADAEQHTPAPELPADTATVLQAHLSACIQAAQTRDWVGLAAHARQLADAADRLDTQAAHRLASHSASPPCAAPSPSEPE